MSTHFDADSILKKRFSVELYAIQYRQVHTCWMSAAASRATTRSLAKHLYITSALIGTLRQCAMAGASAVKSSMKPNFPANGIAASTFFYSLTSSSISRGRNSSPFGIAIFPH